MQSTAKTVDEYLASLPDDRREAIQTIRKVILKNMDPMLEEGMIYGMIGFYVPHRHYPAGYHCDPKMPLGYACLASQKNYIALYSMVVYGDEETLKWFQTEWKKSGKKLDMGKSCIRFKKLDDVPLDLIGELFRRVSVKAYIERYDSILAKMGRGTKKAEVKPKKSDTTKKPLKTKAKASKKPAKKNK